MAGENEKLVLETARMALKHGMGKAAVGLIRVAMEMSDGDNIGNSDTAKKL